MSKWLRNMSWRHQKSKWRRCGSTSFRSMRFQLLEQRRLLAVDPVVAESVRDQLLSGVDEIAVVGAPGRIAVFDPPGAGAGQGAFGVMHDGNFRPMAAAAFWGDGRVVGLGHNGYVDFGSNAGALDTGQFYLNSIAWTSDADGTSATIVTALPGTANWLQSQGFNNASYHSNWESHLAGADVLVAELGRSVSAAKQQAVSNFVQNGGGLITGGTGWGYQQLGSDLVTLDGNVVLRQAGLGWPDGFRTGTTDATHRSTELSNASRALDFAGQFWAGGSASGAQQEESGTALQTVLTVLPDDHPLALDIEHEFSTRASSISATPVTPVSLPLDQAVLTWESQELLTTPVDQVTAHHTAEVIYGTIPAGAERVTETITLDTSKSRWHATGLYAAAGEVVTITVPPSFVGRNYRVRINAHTDNISQRDSWERMPVVHRSFVIDQTTMQVGSAFGGSIFIDVGSTPPGLGHVEVTIHDAIKAPYFVLGEHSDDDWLSGLSDRPAPYAVLVSDNLMLSFRASEAAGLAEPTALMSWWDEVVAQQDQLAAQAQFRTSPEIINIDVQISAGAAHSGFPIQAYERYWGNPADLENLQLNGSWGDFHELGHNHQKSWWTFDGDGEVTVNIFSNHNLESLASNPTGGWAWSTDPVQVMQRALSDVSPGGSYASKPNRWSFWFQLADGFGWDTYREVLAGYQADADRTPGNLPSSNQERMDQWLVRFSTAVGFDLTEYMVDTWGLPVSPVAVSAVSSLPDWMPIVAQDDARTITMDQPATIDVRANDLTFNGVVQLEVFTQGQYGQVAADGNGNLIYMPQAGFYGEDSFTYTVAGSHGQTDTGTVRVTVDPVLIPGDVNLNGVVEGDGTGPAETDDFTAFIAGWGSVTVGLPDVEKFRLGDMNLDGITDFDDFEILRRALRGAQRDAVFQPLSEPTGEASGSGLPSPRPAWQPATMNSSAARAAVGRMDEGLMPPTRARLQMELAWRDSLFSAMVSGRASGVDSRQSQPLSEPTESGEQLDYASGLDEAFLR